MPEAPNKPRPRASRADLSAGFTLGLVAFLWTLAPLQGYDFWFYLSVGRDIVETGQLPWAKSYLGTTSTYAFGAYANHAWLSSLGCYLAYQWLGPLGLVLLRSALLSSITLATYLNCRIAGLSPWGGWIWSLLGLWAIRGRFLLRTYLFTDLCLAFLITLLLLYWKNRLGQKQLGIGIVILFALWSNLHQGYLAGFVLMGLWALFGGVPRLRGIGLCVLAGLATLVRPHGLAFLRFFYDHFANPTAIQGVMEWNRLGFWDTMGAHGPMLVVGLLLIGWALYRKECGPAPIGFALIIAAFVVLSIRSVRSVSELLPVVVPLCALYFPRGPVSGKLRGAALLGVLSLLVFSGRFYSYPTLIALEPRYPLSLSRELQTERGQVFNSYEFGNFLGFQNRPPFVHGITGLFNEQLLRDFLDVLNSTERREEILKRFQVQEALLHYPDDPDAHEGFIEYLFESPDWQLMLWDDTALLFRRGAAESGLVQVRPWRDQPWTDPEAASRELTELLEKRPSARAFTYLSELRAKAGDFKLSQSLARRAVSLNNDDARAWDALMKAAFQNGELALAEQASRELIRLAPAKVDAQFNRGVALVAISQTQSSAGAWWSRYRAKRHLSEALKLDPDFEPARRTLQSLP